MNDGTPAASNPMGTASLVFGVLATLSWGCCCCSSLFPLAGFLAMGITFVLALAATVTGILGRSRAREAGLSETTATVGAVLGVVNFLGLVAWTIMVMFFGGMALLASATPHH